MRWSGWFRWEEKFNHCQEFILTRLIWSHPLLSSFVLIMLMLTSVWCTWWESSFDMVIGWLQPMNLITDNLGHLCATGGLHNPGNCLFFIVDCWLHNPGNCLLFINRVLFIACLLLIVHCLLWITKVTCVLLGACTTLAIFLAATTVYYRRKARQLQLETKVCFCLCLYLCLVFFVFSNQNRLKKTRFS